MRLTRHLLAQDRDGRTLFQKFMLYAPPDPDTVGVALQFLLDSPLSLQRKVAAVCGTTRTNRTPSYHLLLHKGTLNMARRFTQTILRTPNFPLKVKSQILQACDVHGTSGITAATQGDKCDIARQLIPLILTSEALDHHDRINYVLGRTPGGSTALYEAFLEGRADFVSAYCTAVINAAIPENVKHTLLAASLRNGEAAAIATARAARPEQRAALQAYAAALDTWNVTKNFKKDLQIPTTFALPD